ncbi:MAG: HAD-IIB family hydrolase [Mycoplasmatales bacterium]|nr:HAD-IIB family hydrolase [Mycoplasmatales bacterium]
MKKAIYIDLDGTLLNDKYKISKEDQKFLNKIQDDYDIIISTGKSMENSISHYKKLNLNTYMSSSQGQVISLPNKNIHICNYFKKEDIKKIIDDNCIINFIIDTNKKTYVKKNGTFLNNLIENKFHIYKNNNIDKAIALILETNINYKIPVIKGLRLYEWDAGFDTRIVTVRPINSSKEKAMEYINKKMGYEYTIAIGNGRNDIEMMKKANFSIAIKGSHPLVLKNADIVSEFDNNNSGVSRELKKIIQ